MVQNVRNQLNSYYLSGQTLDLKFRREQLKKLKRVILSNEKRILRALTLDLRKPVFEGFVTEVAPVIEEIDYVLKHFYTWTQPRKAQLPLFMFPAKGRIYPQPYGKALIFAPWNYPFQLLLSPIVGALAAGNVIAAKPSELTPETSKVIREIISENFDAGLIQIVEGGPEIANSLLDLQWDYIFFTGSTRVGQNVQKKAAEFLTPTTLELGGKSPVWLDKTAALETSLKRILWAKFLNAGQTCVAPDYLIIHKSHWPQFEFLAQSLIVEFFGAEPDKSSDYARIVNHDHHKRLLGYLNGVSPLLGGQSLPDQKYLAPTIVLEPPLDSPLMQNEIFGPILPVYRYEEDDEVYALLERYPKPLALYLYSEDKELIEKVIEQVPFGGGAINDCIVHLGAPELPFGGIGHSGLGRYHGKHSFETFSHLKSIVHQRSWPDPSLRYAPYKNKIKTFKKWFS